MHPFLAFFPVTSHVLSQMLKIFSKILYITVNQYTKVTTSDREEWLIMIKKLYLELMWTKHASHVAGEMHT